MNDKDEIKELFQKELGNYQAKVDPNLWNGIQAGIGASSAASGATASIGIVGKIVAGVAIVAGIGVGTVLVLNNQEENNQIAEVSNTNNNEVFADSLDRNKDLKEDKTTKDKRSVELTSKISEGENITDITMNSADLTVETNSSAKNVEETKSKSDLVEILDTIQEKSNEAKESNPVVKEEYPNLNTIIEVPKQEITSELESFEIALVNQDNQYVTFTANNLPSNAYIVWNFGDGTIERSQNPEHFYSEPGNYKVECTVKTSTEEITKSIEIDILVSGKIIDLPNVFTPNGDGRNDEFFVKCENIKSFQITIIDQQQNTVFSTNNIDFRWNGMDRNGQPVEAGNYYYIIVGEDYSGNVINKYQQLRIHR